MSKTISVEEYVAQVLDDEFPDRLDEYDVKAMVRDIAIDYRQNIEAYTPIDFKRVYSILCDLRGLSE